MVIGIGIAVASWPRLRSFGQREVGWMLGMTSNDVLPKAGGVPDVAWLSPGLVVISSMRGRWHHRFWLF